VSLSRNRERRHRPESHCFDGCRKSAHSR